MDTQFARTQLLIGKKGLDKLAHARVLVFGLGGVGGACVEALVRAGVGTIGICDGDAVSLSNLNRQILATHTVVGRLKTEVATERIASIHPHANVIAYPFFYNEQTCDAIDFDAYDYICDAIDQVSNKISIIMRAKAQNVPIVSCMGTGNKLDASRFRVAPLSQTSVCPLAKVMRSELKKRGVVDLAVVFSDEPPAIRCSPPASLPTVPPVAGFLLASHVLNQLVES